LQAVGLEAGQRLDELQNFAIGLLALIELEIGD
jgi:hypothetical protein